MSQPPAATEDAKAPNPISVFELMNKLEQDALTQVAAMHKTSIENGSTLIEDMKKTSDPSVSVGDALLQIMGQGAKEFKQTTGRNMTYSEMRSMYG